MKGLYQRGDTLAPHLQREALVKYVHRFTGDHKPRWAIYPRDNGEPYPVQFADDTDWLANTFFPVHRKTGKLRSGDSYTHATWPNNPELRGKYGKSPDTYLIDWDTGE